MLRRIYAGVCLHDGMQTITKRIDEENIRPNDHRSRDSSILDNESRQPASFVGRGISIFDIAPPDERRRTALIDLPLESVDPQAGSKIKSYPFCLGEAVRDRERSPEKLKGYIACSNLSDIDRSRRFAFAKSRHYLFLRLRDLDVAKVGRRRRLKELPIITIGLYGRKGRVIPR